MGREIQSFTSVDLQNAGIIYGEMGEFPATPKDGMTVMKEGVLYHYTTLRGAQTWYPLNSKYSSYVHTQGLASQSWTINHDFDTENVMFMIYDTQGNLVWAEHEFTSSNTLTLTFTEAIAGKCVVFAMTEMYTNTVTSTSANIGGVIIENGTVQASNLFSGIFVSDESQIPANMPAGSMIMYRSNTRLRFFETTVVGQTDITTMDELTPFRAGTLVWYYRANGGETQLSLPAGYDYELGDGEIEVEIEGNPLFLINAEFVEIDSNTIGFASTLRENEIVTVKIRHH